VLVLGVDENGMGPRLGPLVSTGIVLEVRSYRPEPLYARGLELGVGDSKATSAFGKMARAEGLTLALVEQLVGRAPTSADLLLGDLGLDGPLTLRAQCPTGESVTQCWGAPLRLPAFGGSVEEGRTIVRGLARSRVRVRRVRTAVACAGHLNRALDDGTNKLRVDLGLFERLILDARASSTEDLRAICGMVGGLRRYAESFTHLGARGVETVGEEKGASVYRVPSVGTVSFEVKADARHLPVALASMVGKYVREIAMARINRFYGERIEGLPKASGYHDPVTRRFVEETAPLRKRLAIAPDCFERRA